MAKTFEQNKQILDDIRKEIKERKLMDSVSENILEDFEFWIANESIYIAPKHANFFSNKFCMFISTYCQQNAGQFSFYGRPCYNKAIGEGIACQMEF